MDLQRVATVAGVRALHQDFGPVPEDVHGCRRRRAAENRCECVPLRARFEEN